MNSKETIDYIGDMAGQLETLANEAGQPLLAYLFRLACRECEAIGDGTQKAPSSQGTSTR